MAVSVSLADDIDISRGDMIARVTNQPDVTQEFDATVCWMADENVPGARPRLHHQAHHQDHPRQGDGARLPARRQHAASGQVRNCVEAQRTWRITLRTQKPLLLDEYSPQRGHRFVHPDRSRHQRDHRRGDGPRHGSGGSACRHAQHRQTRVAGNCRDRLSKGRTVWFTGLSGSGKSSVAVLVEQKLLESVFRHTFSTVTTCGTDSTPTSASPWDDRCREPSQVAHIATLMADAGLRSWYRRSARSTSIASWPARCTTAVGSAFRGVCDTPLADCEKRDPKGLYAKARAGEITHFTGIRQPLSAAEETGLRLTPERTPTTGAGGYRYVRQAPVSDHELAARLASEAGELLLGVRQELAHATADERKLWGQAVSRLSDGCTWCGATR